MRVLMEQIPTRRDELLGAAGDYREGMSLGALQPVSRHSGARRCSTQKASRGFVVSAKGCPGQVSARFSEQKEGKTQRKEWLEFMRIFDQSQGSERN